MNFNGALIPHVTGWLADTISLKAVMPFIFIPIAYIINICGENVYIGTVE